MKSYQDLDVWQAGIQLVEHIYAVTRGFPTEERFGLTSQAQRAAVSIPSNIAEGYGRLHRAEYIQHVAIARGSLMELQTHLVIVKRLGLATEETLKPVWELSERVGQMLTRLIAALRAAQHPNPESGFPAPATRNPTPDTRNPAPETRHPIPETMPEYDP